MDGGGGEAECFLYDPEYCNVITLQIYTLKKRNTLSMTKRRITLILILIFIISAAAWVIYGNTAIEKTLYTVSDEELPEEFSDFTITQISDLHNALFGKNNKRLIEKIISTSPDIIVITGDIIDQNRTDTDISLDFVKQAVKIAPTYYVTGNHEAIADGFDIFIEEAKKAGMVYLENDTVTLTKDGAEINLTGVDDPFLLTSYISENMEESLKTTLSFLLPRDGYNILLAHRPNYFDIYSSFDADLIISGHVHGGQFRLPFIGGLYAPDQGFNPEYDAGSYTDGKAQMIISRGLGNSRFPVRLNNTPEIVVITLKKS